MVRFRVAGLTLALRARRPTMAIALPRACRDFAVPRGGDIELSLVEEPPPRPDGALLFDSGAVWRVHRHGSGLLYTFRTSVLEPPVYKAVAIDEGLSTGVLYFPRPRLGRRPRLALDFPLDELLFQHHFARNGSMEVHCCGLVSGGGAVVFCGQSGAGKSTTARLWRRALPGTQVLSDDRIILQQHKGRSWAFGTPWHGDGGFAAPAGRPLRAVFFLRHARRTHVAPLGKAEAAARLFARTFPPPWDAAAVAKVLESCARVVDEVPCYELAFVPDASAVAAARAWIPSGSARRH